MKQEIQWTYVPRVGEALLIDRIRRLEERRSRRSLSDGASAERHAEVVPRVPHPPGLATVDFNAVENACNKNWGVTELQMVS